GLGAVDVPALYFCREPGEAMRESPWLLGRYVRRATSPIELRRWGSGVAGFLNRFGSPLVDPRRVGDLVSETGRAGLPAGARELEEGAG
ncbi:unnamed protein product, partial [Prorocentrum cordatum]